MASTFWQDRLTQTAAIIDAYEAAILAITGSGAQSYTLDTGQSVQKVTKLDIEFLQSQLDTLYNRYAMLDARCNGVGLYVRPVW